MIQPQPPGFQDHKFTFQVTLAAAEKDVWNWLNNTKTFTDTQVWPYRVEFYSPDPETIPNGFHEEILTNHTGPLINFAGKLTKIDANYRDLQYFYGSYALSFKWFRPYRLQFWTSSSDDKTELTCTLSTYVKPKLYGFWDRSQRIFWSRFRNWAKKSIKAQSN